MSKKISQSKNQFAQIDNRVLEAFIQKNNLLAFKVLLYIGKAQLNKNIDVEALDDDELYKIPIKIYPMREYYGLSSRDLRLGIKKLSDTTINYRKIENKKDKETFVSLLPRAKINYTDETIECYVFGEVLKLIYAINKYSKIDVKNFIMLEKKHSARMLLLLGRIANYKKIETYTDPQTLQQTKVDVMPKRQHYELDELNKIFGTNYKSYSLFEKKVLTVCKEDLDIHSRISFLYTLVKDRVGEKVRSRGRTPIVHVTIDVINKKI